MVQPIDTIRFIQSVSPGGTFTPLEVVLMSSIVVMFFLLIKLQRESITAINNNTNALNQITALRKPKIKKP